MPLNSTLPASKAGACSQHLRFIQRLLLQLRAEIRPTASDLPVHENVSCTLLKQAVTDGRLHAPGQRHHHLCVCRAQAWRRVMLLQPRRPAATVRAVGRGASRDRITSGAKGESPSHEWAGGRASGQAVGVEQGELRSLN